MTRSRAALAVAVVAVAALAGCSGGDASQSEVQGDVAELLAEDGYGEHTDLSATEVGAASACVAQSLFDPDQFSKDERNEVASSVDSEPPSEGLRTKFVGLVDRCVEAAVAGEGEEETADDNDDDAGRDADNDDTTTTSD